MMIFLFKVLCMIIIIKFELTKKKNWWKFFVQSIVFMIILMKFSPKIGNEFFYQYG